MTGWVVSAMGAVILFLLGAIWQWGSSRFTRIEADLERERSGRAGDRHAFQNSVAVVANSLNRFELEAAKEYASKATLEKMEERLSTETRTEFRKLEETLREIFEELRHKQDKP